jgi:hypothetical protein
MDGDKSIRTAALGYPYPTIGMRLDLRRAQHSDLPQLASYLLRPAEDVLAPVSHLEQVLGRKIL